MVFNNLGPGTPGDSSPVKDPALPGDMDANRPCYKPEITRVRMYGLVVSGQGRDFAPRGRADPSMCAPPRSRFIAVAV